MFYNIENVTVAAVRYFTLKHPYQYTHMSRPSINRMSSNDGVLRVFELCIDVGSSAVSMSFHVYGPTSTALSPPPPLSHTCE